MKIAVIQKMPSKVNYEKSFNIQKPDIFNLSSKKVTRLLKKDVDLVVQTKAEHVIVQQRIAKGEADQEDLGFCSEAYDLVILIGSEAVKMFTKVSSVSDYTGKIAPGKNDETNFFVSINPAVLLFKPENRPVFDETVSRLKDLLEGKVEEQIERTYEFYRETSDIKSYLVMVLDNPNWKVIGLDSETSALAARDGYMLGMSISHEINQGIYCDADCFDQECIDLLQEIVSTRRTVFHNAKFDMHFFKYHLGTNFIGCDVHDTMIIHYLLDERTGTHGLKALTMKYGNLGDYERDLDDFKKSYCKTHKIKAGEFSYDLIPWDILKIYAAKDTDATLQLYHKFYPILEKNADLLRCYDELMLPALHLLTKMEDRGIPVSADRLRFAKTLLTQEIEVLQEELYSYEEIKIFEQGQGQRFNPASPLQLRKLLFDVIGLNPTGKLTDTGAICTDAEVLMELAEFHEIPMLIMNIKQKSKLKNTYIDKLLPAIDRDNRVRTGFNLTTTSSGRLSSSGKFNMQQLPRDNPIIKGCVKARPGYKIVAVDLVTAEVYYAAVLSGDKAMQQIFVNMQKDPSKYPDFHSTVAHMVFKINCEPNQVKKMFPYMRQAAKAVNFGILYGSGPASVAEQINIALGQAGLPQDCDVDTAKGYIQTYFAQFPQLHKWVKACHAQIKAKGFIYNHFGRKRRLHNINSVDRGVAAAEVRSGFNAVIQSVSSDHLVLGAVDADNEIMRTGMDALIFALVHDSIVAEVREDLVPDYLELIVRNVQIDRGCSILGCPVGVEQDSEEGGSEDYGCGKLAKMFPELAAI